MYSEKAKELARNYYKKNKERIKETVKKYRIKNKEKLKIRKKKYRNSARGKELEKEYRNRNQVRDNGLSGRYRKMKERCRYPGEINYQHYGGRGIKVMWESYEAFKADMYESYLAHLEKFGRRQTTIERIDNDGNYCKENCRWATWAEQVKNKRQRR